MKIKVAEGVRGSLAVPALKSAFKGGTELIMTEEQFWAESTQWAVQNGYLIPIDPIEPRQNQEPGMSLRSKNPHPLAINILGRAINCNEVFFVSNEQLQDRQISDAIALGIFVREGTKGSAKSESATSDIAKPKKITRKNDSDNTKPLPTNLSVSKSKQVSKKAANNNVKTVLGTFSNEGEMPPSKVTLPEIKNTRKTQAYVHRPNGARINEPPQTVRAKDNPLIIDVEGNNEEVE